MSELITKEELYSYNYGPELADKLKELGVGDVWQRGVKKKEIIDNAFKKLSQLKELEAKGVTGEDAEKEIEQQNKEEEELELTQAQKDFKAKKDAEDAEVERLKTFSKEVLEKNLAICKVNLKSASKAKKNILLEKIRNIENALKG